MTRVVIDASAGAEIVAATARGRALARLLPNEAELWVPEHFYVEVLGVLRHQSVIARTIGPDRAELAIDRLRRWHLRQAAVAPGRKMSRPSPVSPPLSRRRRPA